MPKKSNREMVVLGTVHIAGRDRPTKIVQFPPSPLAELTPPEVAQLRDEQLVKENRSRFAELVERETEDANAAADAADERMAAGLYAGSGADPGSIVGLDAFTPGGDTATDGDPNRTDPDPS